MLPGCTENTLMRSPSSSSLRLGCNRRSVEVRFVLTLLLEVGWIGLRGFQHVFKMSPRMGILGGGHAAKPAWAE